MQHLDEALFPASNRGLELGLQRRLVDGGHWGALRHAHHEVQLRERRLADPRRVVDLLRAEGVSQQPLDAQAHGRVEAVARQEDEGRDEAAELVGAQEDAGAAALAQAADLARHRQEVRHFVLEQLGATVRAPAAGLYPSGN